MSEYRLTWRVDQDERLNIVDYPDRLAAFEHAVELSEENPGHWVDVLETKGECTLLIAWVKDGDPHQ